MKSCLLLLLLCMVSAGCPAVDDVFCEGSDELQPGQATANVNGDVYSSDRVTWSAFTSGQLYITFPREDGVSMEVEANVWVPGLASGGPQLVEFSGDSTGGSVTLEIDDDSWTSSSADEGRLWITDFRGEGSVLVGCFFVRIEPDVEVTQAIFLADTP